MMHPFAFAPQVSPRFARVGASAASLSALAPKCTVDCPLFTLPDEASHLITVVPRGYVLKLVGARAPDWLEVTYSYPGAQGLSTVTERGWIRARDTRPVPAPPPSGGGLGGPGGLPTSPSTTAQPPPAPTSTPPSTTPPTGTSTTPAGGGAQTTDTSVLESVGEFALLTAPAWGAFLYTRFVR